MELIGHIMVISDKELENLLIGKDMKRQDSHAAAHNAKEDEFMFVLEKPMKTKGLFQWQICR